MDLHADVSASLALRKAASGKNLVVWGVQHHSLLRWAFIDQILPYFVNAKGNADLQLR